MAPVISTIAMLARLLVLFGVAVVEVAQRQLAIKLRIKFTNCQHSR